MILKELKIRGFRPFYEEVTLEVDPKITVLTGANDTGKSAILDVLQLIGDGERARNLGPDDINDDIQINPPEQENELLDEYAIATYKLYQDIELYEVPMKAGSEIDFKLNIRSHGLTVEEFRDANGNSLGIAANAIRHGPRIFYLSPQEQMLPTIDRVSNRPAENKMLQLAFDSEGFWDDLEGLNPRVREAKVEDAGAQLNEKLTKLKPSSLNLDFDLAISSDNPIRISLKLVDNFGGRASPNLRGDGYQKLMIWMLYLQMLNVETPSIVLLYDEPENSLHADAQHSLRKMLEDFSEDLNIQIVYATHSPAMINPSRPETLRLLSREQTESGIATTRIDNKPYIDGNFQSVRTQLGILAADSLLFSSITVIVEGPSDSRGLNLLFRRLHQEWEDDTYSDLNVLQRLTMFFPAGGYGEFDKWLKVAQSNGVLPILLYDGDQEAKAQRMDAANPNVPVLWFDKDKEFEDIVPREIYFQALAEIVLGNRKITKVEYEKWESNANLVPQMMFTKRVKKWLRDEFGERLNKPQVMAKAIELVDLGKLKMNTIDKLIAEIRKTSLKL